MTPSWSIVSANFIHVARCFTSMPPNNVSHSQSNCSLCNNKSRIGGEHIRKVRVSWRKGRNPSVSDTLPPLPASFSLILSLIRRVPQKPWYVSKAVQGWKVTVWTGVWFLTEKCKRQGCGIFSWSKVWVKDACEFPQSDVVIGRKNRTGAL